MVNGATAAVGWILVHVGVVVMIHSSKISLSVEVRVSRRSVPFGETEEGVLPIRGLYFSSPPICAFATHGTFSTNQNRFLLSYGVHSFALYLEYGNHVKICREKLHEQTIRGYVTSQLCAKIRISGGHNTTKSILGLMPKEKKDPCTRTEKIHHRNPS